ncbi:hypothetical protein E4U42_001718 [Claviceps africana]|uniref:Uncharacterized protein n=1 Tax=Claviceps africana TaxID=83212 RepID=A0A8K0NHX4_9HYPO|nr:hypothetical protein E4U42_001718 [Claviceps africana]
MAGVFEQFVAFGTDIDMDGHAQNTKNVMHKIPQTSDADRHAVGLERLMRLLQSLCTILTCHPVLIPMLLPWQTKTGHQHSELVMLELSDRLNLTRRALRLFWCLGSFRSSVTALASPADKDLAAWLSVTADSLFGLFGLVESLTLPDLVRARHLSVWGHAEAVRMDAQAQGLWLAALSCAIVSSGIGLWRAAAAGEVVSGAGGQEKGGRTGAGTAERRGPDGERRRRIGRLARKLAAEGLDVVIPVWSTGLADVEPGTVAVAMFLSTVLTGYDVWERCGLAIDACG